MDILWLWALNPVKAAGQMMTEHPFPFLQRVMSNLRDGNASPQLPASGEDAGASIFLPWVCISYGRRICAVCHMQSKTGTICLAGSGFCL